MRTRNCFMYQKEFHTCEINFQFVFNVCVIALVSGGVCVALHYSSCLPPPFTSVSGLLYMHKSRYGYTNTALRLKNIQDMTHFNYSHSWSRGPAKGRTWGERNSLWRLYTDQTIILSITWIKLYNLTKSFVFSGKEKVRLNVCLQTDLAPNIIGNISGRLDTSLTNISVTWTVRRVTGNTSHLSAMH